MAKTIKVTQLADDAEVPTEVIADAIVAISAGIKKLRTGRLNDRALLLLIAEATPNAFSDAAWHQWSYQRSRSGLFSMESLLSKQHF